MVKRINLGFSLLEMTVVLAILALLLGGIVLPLSSQYRNLQSYKQAADELEMIREALIGYALINGRLPCPAVSATDGLDRCLATGSNCATNADCSGFLPWEALGVKALDPWNKFYGYRVSIAFARQEGFALNTAGTLNIQTRTAASSFNLTNLATDVPAVILSHGQKNYGTYMDGSTVNGDTGTNDDEKQNYDAAIGTSGVTLFIQRPYAEASGESGGEFDDVVTWISPFVLFNRMVMAQRLP